MTENDVLITDLLVQRSPRTPNWEAENQSLRYLGRQLMQPTQELFKHFTKIAQEITQSGTAGVSLIEATPSGEDMIRWVAIAGELLWFEGSTTPRDLSICGVCLRRGCAQLYSYPARYFTSLQGVEPVIVEALVVPLVLEGQALGTIWIVSHDEQRQFDSEDLRVMTSLADFLTAALMNAQMRQAVEESSRREQAATSQMELILSKVNDSFIVYDVTKREQEPVFHQSKEQFEKAVDRMSSNVVEQRNFDVNSYKSIWERTHQRLYPHFKEFIESIHPDDQEQVQSAVYGSVGQDQFDLEYRVVRPDGSVSWVRDRGFLIRDQNETPNQMVSFAEDITERKYAELLLNEQKRLLELIASGKSMDECLSSVCTSVSKLNPGVRACFLLTDAQRLKFPRSITPDFPPSFGQGLKDAPINDLAIGTCGEAVYSGKPIICADIANDARWSQGWRDLCIAHGVLAGYSSPILDVNNLPLGSLMLCFSEARMPTNWEYQLAEFGTKVASIVFERDRLSLAVRESEEKYRTLFHSMGEAFALCEIILDDDGKPIDARMLEVNSAQETMTGITTEETAGNTIRELLPDLDDWWFETYGRVALGGETIRFENYVPSLSRWYDIYGYKVGKKDDGKFALIYSDITARKQAEESLRRSEERYRTLFESIDQGFCVIEMLFDENDTPFDYRFLEINPAFEKQTGLKQAEGKTVRQLVPNLEEHWFEIYGQVALTGEPIRFENGSKEMNRWFDVYAFRIEQPESRKVAVLFQDITQQKQAEVLLRESEEQFRNMADNAPVMIWVTDDTGYCTYLSRSWYDFSGQTEETGLGFGWLDVVHPEDSEFSKNIFLDANARASAFQLEYRLQRKDGEYRTCIDAASPWFGTDGQFKGYIGSVIDITERKQAEIQQQEQARELTQLNHSLMRTTELLAERNQELNSFTHIVSHDLKAPLRAIANLSQWIEDDLEEQLDENNQRQMQLLRNRVERMEAMIEGLLDYSRVGRTEIDTQPVDIAELLNEIFDSLALPPIFTIKIQSELPTIVAKRLLISQVFANLISNAIKHHPRPNGQLEISATQKGQFYEFAIADDGDGIAPEYHEKIFGIFQTINSRDVKESTGIGLSIVKKIVETEGGEITLSSELGSGATFRFTWPIESEVKREK